MFNTLRHLFTPHHTNNHRPRVLHPAGMWVLIAFALIFHSGLELLQVAPPQGLVLGYASDITVAQVLSLTNQERASVGLPTLSLNTKLSQAAAAKAADMFSDDYWAHISPTGKTPWEFIKGTGYKYSVAGENLARDFSDSPSMVKAWMDSPTHKANIVHAKYEETGIAVVNGKLNNLETTLVVQMFGKPTAAAVFPKISDSAPQTLGDTAEALAGAETTPTLLETGLEPGVVSAQADTPFILSPLALKRSAVLAVVFLIMAVLVIDELIIQHKKTVRFVGRNIAHLSFLAIILVIIITITRPGGIQ